MPLFYFTELTELWLVLAELPITNSLLFYINLNPYAGYKVLYRYYSSKVVKRFYIIIIILR